MQNRFPDTTVKAPSPLGRRQSATFTQNTDHIDHILHSVRQQIERWGPNAKWKIDLVLTEPGQPQHQPEAPTTLPALSAPPATPAAPPATPAAPPATKTTAEESQYRPSAYSLPVSASTDYPWDYVAPYHDKWNSGDNEDQEQELREAMERNQYLESIVRSQADQLRQSPGLPPDLNNVVETMKQVYLMSENEHRLRYLTETKMLHKDIQTLTKRLQRMAQLLHSIEDIQVTTKDTELEKETLLEDKKCLLQKLHLVQLRLKARDAELDFLRQKQQKDEPTPVSPALNASPRFADAARNNRPYLFQQQYSPKLRSEIRPNTISGLDSLGILADQMLSDPDFESQHASDTERSMYTPPPNTATRKGKPRKRLFNTLKEEEADPTIYYYNRPAYSSSNTPTYYNNSEKRSKRSIDSANTLLSMFPSRRSLTASTLEVEEPSTTRIDDQQQQPKPKSKLAYVRWTPDEDQLLRASVERNGTGNWDKVASMVPDRSSQQCRQRWSKYLDQRHASPSPSMSASNKHTETASSSSMSRSGARHSPSIASLLNESPEMKPTRSLSPPARHPQHLPLGYHPPSPISTPKHQRNFVDNHHH